MTFRDLPEAATDGVDIGEARREAIPTPSNKHKGEEIVAPDTAAR